jgi:hypothetical protein
MTMRQALTLTMIVLLALAGGCNQKANDHATAATNAQPQQSAAATQASQDLTPEQLGELGAQIGKTPDRANDLLTQHGLTKETFEAQIRKVTENPDASKRYADAYRKASA